MPLLPQSLPIQSALAYVGSISDHCVDLKASSLTQANSFQENLTEDWSCCSPLGCVVFCMEPHVKVY
ncbi:Argininosuccinate lyase [Frankliniella fusca]|uniref:Argininosuccinate lyase n=2 Tax=Frankliniella fusca TaxID=407009 RepID=A0AAE1LA25_9NEOP|nr:Argininosuccinate lyase [Frankliniella fusca]